MSTDIVSALALLDVDNNDHWTSDGLPRMEALEQLSGLKGLTRSAVTAAQPGFSRAVVALRAKQAAAQPAAPQAEPQPAVVNEQPQVQQEQSAPEVVQEDPEDTDEGEASQGEVSELESARSVLAQIARKREAINKEYAAQQGIVDRIIAKMESETSASAANSSAIRQYLEGRKRALAEAASKGQTLVDPVDRAFARPQGYGGGRPDFS